MAMHGTTSMPRHASSRGGLPPFATVRCLLISSLVGRLRMLSFHAKRCLLNLAWCFALLSGLVLDVGMMQWVELLQSERDGV